MSDLEEKCQDAVFDISDMRERFPAHCANKLAKCLRIESEIEITNIRADSMQINHLEAPLSAEDEKFFIFEELRSQISRISRPRRDLRSLLQNINDLIDVTQQLKDEQYCNLNICLKKFKQNKITGK